MIPVPSTLALKLVAGACALLAVALLIHDRNRWKSVSALRQEQFAAERATHSATVAYYRAATERARREDTENLARVKAEQDAISERTLDDYENRIAAARAHAERLRRDAQSTAAHSGSGGAAPVPRLPAAAEGAAQAAGQDGLSYADRLIATEQAIQLDELIRWVRRQSLVSASGPDQPGADRERP
jgi:hypothetical protein